MKGWLKSINIWKLSGNVISASIVKFRYITELEYNCINVQFYVKAKWVSEFKVLMSTSFYYGQLNIFEHISGNMTCIN